MSDGKLPSYKDQWPGYRGAVTLTMNREDWQHFVEMHAQAANLVRKMKKDGSVGPALLKDMVQVRNAVYGILTRIATSEQLVGVPCEDPLRPPRRNMDVG